MKSPEYAGSTRIATAGNNLDGVEVAQTPSCSAIYEASVPGQSFTLIWQDIEVGGFSGNQKKDVQIIYNNSLRYSACS